MNDLRSPLEDRPYRPATRPLNNEHVISTPEYYRTKFDALRQSRFFPLASVLAAVVVFGGIISYAYNQGSQSGVNATTPIVQASNEDYKEKPANPGGMDVPFQDAVVFDQLQSNNQQTASADTVESLLPEAEQPVAATETAPSEEKTTTAAKTETKKTETKETASAATTTAMTEAPKTEELAAPSTTASTTTSTATETAVVKTDAPKETKTASQVADEVASKLDNVAPASAPATTKIESGNYRIQLGAFRDQAAAKAAWTKLQKQFSSQLTAVTPDFPRADLGAKGVFYRVQGTNLSKATADELCRSINAAQSGSCLVTR